MLKVVCSSWEGNIILKHWLKYDERCKIKALMSWYHLWLFSQVIFSRGYRGVWHLHTTGIFRNFHRIKKTHPWFWTQTVPKKPAVCGHLFWYVIRMWWASLVPFEYGFSLLIHLFSYCSHNKMRWRICYISLILKVVPCIASFFSYELMHELMCIPFK